MSGPIDATPGQLAYEEDLRRCPNYHDGTPRKTWDQLTFERQSWQRNPTPRDYIALHKEDFR